MNWKPNFETNLDVNFWGKCFPGRGNGRSPRASVAEASLFYLKSNNNIWKLVWLKQREGRKDNRRLCQRSSDEPICTTLKATVYMRHDGDHIKVF